MTQLRDLLRAGWHYLREVSGENDYARYLARVLAAGEDTSATADPMSPAEFYLSKLHLKYSRISRCC